ncbi:MAG: hypothetical protein AAE977_04970 [Thermoplasmataceae archaeon]
MKFNYGPAVINEKRINVLTKLAGRSLIITNIELDDIDVVLSYKGRGRSSVHSGQQNCFLR